MLDCIQTIMKKQNFALWADVEVRHHPKLILKSMLCILDWLDELHQASRAHGDIRPSSLMVLENQNFCRETFDRTIRGEIREHSIYAPPETFGSTSLNLQATPAGDIYSLTAVLYQALTGQNAPRSPLRLAKDTLEIPRSLGSSVNQLIKLGMSLKIQERPGSVAAYRELLNKALISKEVESHPALLDSRQPTVATRLPKNLSVGKITEIPIKDVINDQGTWEIQSLSDSPELGVIHEKESQLLKFNPTSSGEFKINIQFRLLGLGLKFDKISSRTIDVTVNADPKALWKEIDPPVDSVFPKSHVDYQELRTPFARIHGSSRRGRSHAHEGSFREDDLSASFHEKSGWHLLVASDGAGSAKLSRRGSKIVCSEAISQLNKWLDTSPESELLSKACDDFSAQVSDERKSSLKNHAYSILGNAAIEVRKAITREAETITPPATSRDFHATLLIACARKTDNGWVIISFSIGDGGIVYSRKGAIPVAICSPDSGEFSGQTTFITVPTALKDAQDIMKRIHIAHVTDLESLVLMTDGITDPLFPTEESLSDLEVWTAFWNQLPEVAKSVEESTDSRAKMIEWLNFWSPGNHDDRTIILLIPTS